MAKYTTDEEIIKLVENNHWIHGKSLRLIERENGLSNDTIRKRCIKLGITTKSRSQSSKDNEKHCPHPKGSDHWRMNNIEASKRLAEQHSLAMKTNNPVHNPEVRNRMLDSLQKTFEKNTTFHESLFIDILTKSNNLFKSQPRVDKYIADFIIGDNVIVELDGRGHSGRTASDLVRDKFLCGLGFTVVRFDQDMFFNKRAIKPTVRGEKVFRIIKDLVPGFNIPDFLPAIECKYRVRVRKPNPFTEIIY